MAPAVEDWGSSPSGVWEHWLLSRGPYVPFHILLYCNLTPCLCKVGILRSPYALINQHRQAPPTPGSSVPMTLIYQSAPFVHSYNWHDSMVQTVPALAHWYQGQQCWRCPVWSASGIDFWPRFIIVSPAHLHKDKSSCQSCCQSCTYKGHADIGIPWVGTLWDTLFLSWRLPVSSEAQGMDCCDACSMGWLVPGGSNHHVLLPKQQPWGSAWLWQDGAKEAVLWFGSIGQWIHEICLFFQLRWGTCTVLYCQWIWVGSFLCVFGNYLSIDIYHISWMSVPNITGVFQIMLLE